MIDDSKIRIVNFCQYPEYQNYGNFETTARHLLPGQEFISWTDPYANRDLKKEVDNLRVRNCLEIRELAAQRCTRSIREGIGSDPSCFGREPRREGWYDKVRMLLNKNSDCQCG